jgi:hypothetical protein
MASTSATFASESLGGRAYQKYLNPQWVALPNLLDRNVEYERCSGNERLTKDGLRMRDYLSGFGGRPTGHHHPFIGEGRKEGLDPCGPAMVVREKQFA